MLLLLLLLLLPRRQRRRGGSVGYCWLRMLPSVLTLSVLQPLGVQLSVRRQNAKRVDACTKMHTFISNLAMCLGVWTRLHVACMSMWCKRAKRKSHVRAHKNRAVREPRYAGLTLQG